MVQTPSEDGCVRMPRKAVIGSGDLGASSAVDGLAEAHSETKDSRIVSSILGFVFKLGEGLEGRGSIGSGEHSDTSAETPIQEVFGKEEPTPRSGEAEGGERAQGSDKKNESSESFVGNAEDHR